MKILFLILMPFLLQAQGFTTLGIIMGNDVSYSAETLAYVARVEADGGVVININAVNDAYAITGFDSISVWCSASFGIKKNANNKVTKLYNLTSDLIYFSIESSDTSKSPTYSATGMNGMPTLTFDNSNDYMIIANQLASDIILTNKGSLTFVLKQNGAAANNGLLSYILPSNTNELSLWCTYANTFYSDFGNESSGGRVTATQPLGWDDNNHIIQFIRNEATPFIYSDGVSLSVTGTFSDDLDNTQTGQLELGRRAVTTFYSGNVSEIIISKGVLNAPALRTLLNNRYSIH
jgi:hypothetical protein